MSCHITEELREFRMEKAGELGCYLARECLRENTKILLSELVDSVLKKLDVESDLIFSDEEMVTFRNLVLDGAEDVFKSHKEEAWRSN